MKIAYLKLFELPLAMLLKEPHMHSESVIGNGRSWIPYRTTMKLKHRVQQYFSYIWWSALLMEETRVSISVYHH
jgi:hypothetical protein